MNHHEFDQFADPETQARIAQYEMAFRMQTSVPELADISSEPKHILDMYGPDVHKPGTFARCCLLARRLAERDVRFVQIFHRGWDQHGNLAGDLPRQCKDVDQATFALVTDLKQRGLLDDTLVIWGGEFGRTVYCQGKLTRDNYGRDHHPKCFPVWMAGAGIKPGVVYGETDDFSYNVVADPVHIHDLNATILHCLGIDHRRLSFKFQGLDVRLTGVEEHIRSRGFWREVDELALSRERIYGSLVQLESSRNAPPGRAEMQPIRRATSCHGADAPCDPQTRPRRVPIAIASSRLSLP